MVTTQGPPPPLTATRPPSPSFRHWRDHSKRTWGLPGVFSTSKVSQDSSTFITSKVSRDQVLLVPQKYFGMTRYFKYFKSTHRYPNLHDHYRGSHHQTATEAHHGQHLGPPGHLHHVRHGAQSLPWEVPCFKSRSSGWISIEIAIIDCFRLWHWCKFRWHWQ